MEELLILRFGSGLIFFVELFYGLVLLDGIVVFFVVLFVLVGIVFELLLLLLFELSVLLLNELLLVTTVLFVALFLLKLTHPNE